MLRPLLAWLLILLFAILNGVFREAVLLPHLSQQSAFLASGVLLCTIILALAAVLAPWLRLATATRALGVGLFWFCLTIAFEFGFGVAQGRSLDEMLAPYRFTDGNIWPIVLGVALFAPLIGRLLRPGVGRGGADR